MSQVPIYEIIILGAGPAGISVAVEAISKGMSSSKILIIEKSHEIIHMINTKYPEEKPVLANYKGKQVESDGALSISDMSKKEFLSFMNKTIHESKVDILFNNTVKKIVKLKNGQLQVCTDDECYISNSVFLAIGSMSAPRTLAGQIDKESIPKIFYDIQNVTSVMKNILVVGGGDSAAEYAMILSSRGHNVSLSYRGKEFARMIESNSASLLTMVDQKKIRYYAETEIVTIASSEYSLKVSFNNGDKESYHAIVAALGNDRPANYLSAIGIKLCHEGREVFSESSLHGVFAVGDIASSSGGTINIAFNSGAKAFQEAYNFYINH